MAFHPGRWQVGLFLYDYKFGVLGVQPRYVRKIIEAGRFSDDVLIVEVRP